jgi:hypothetical protein
MFKSCGLEFKQFVYSTIAVVNLYLVFTSTRTYLLYWDVLGDEVA